MGYYVWVEAGLDCGAWERHQMFRRVAGLSCGGDSDVWALSLEGAAAS